MSQTFLRITALFAGCVILASCGGERRVDGEMAFDSNSMVTMAESFLQAGDYGNAIRLYQRAANENPKHIPSRLGLAKTHQGMGATDAALDFYEQVLALDPDNQDAKLGVAQMLITKNRPAEAISHLEDLSRADPEDYRIFNTLGLAYDLLGEQEQAQMSYGQGLALEPDNISLLNNLALSFAFEGQYAPAIQLLGKAINLDYTVTKAQQNLVLVYVLSGEVKTAREIGTSLMTPEELDNDIRQYQWVESLKPAQRAQAIFLGVKNFDDEDSSPSSSGAEGEARAPEPTDPKKRRLQELLAQEKLPADPEPDSEPELEPGKDEVTAPAAEAVSSSTPTRDAKYRLQLGAYPNEYYAKEGWRKLVRDSAGILEGYGPLIQQVTLEGERTLYRLFVDGIVDKGPAGDVCGQLRDRDIDCLVIRAGEDQGPSN